MDLSALVTDPLYIIPLFISSGAPTRLIIVLLVHPVYVEASEAVGNGRGSKGSRSSRSLRAEGGLGTFDKVAEELVEGTLFEYSYKLKMAFFRRFMLLNMGSAQTTMFAIVATSVEEASAQR